MAVYARPGIFQIQRRQTHGGTGMPCSAPEGETGAVVPAINPSFYNCCSPCPYFQQPKIKSESKLRTPPPDLRGGSFYLKLRIAAGIYRHIDILGKVRVNYKLM
jgi:hypothetical protein